MAAVAEILYVPPFAKGINTMSSSEIFEAAQLLEPLERWELVNRLWQSLPVESLQPDKEELALLDRRLAEIESGEAETVPIDEVRAYLRTWTQRDG
jgi:putative addiction module component (TIGR02574 family)